MKHLLSKITATTTSSLLFLGMALPAFADDGTSVDPCSGGNLGSGFSGLCNIKSNNLGQIVGAAVTFVLVAIAIIALFFLIFGGFRWVTSGGDKGKVDEARKTVIAAIVGLVIAFLAFFILSVVLGFFGLSLSNLTLPSLSNITQ